MITIRHLIESHEFNCSLLAGARGVGNEITWAHVSELNDPTAWLVGGELLMSAGMNLPPEPEEQVAYLRRLAAKRISGLALGDSRITKLDVAPVTDEFLTVADELEFPILLVSGGTPFIAIVQHVAMANRDMLHRRLTRRLSVYEGLHKVVRSDSSVDSLLQRLEEVSGYEMWVLSGSGNPLFAGTTAPPFGIDPHEAARMLTPVDGGSVRAPRRLQLETSDEPVFVVPILARDRSVGVLIARPVGGDPADSLILHHVSALIGLLALDDLRDRERLRREGAEALARLLVAADAGEPAMLGELFDRKDSTRYCFVSIAVDEAEGWDDLHNRLLERGFAHVITRRSSRAAAIIELISGVGVADVVGLWPSALPGSVAGFSSEFPPDAEVVVARRQARWSLQCAAARGTPAEHFASARPPEWLHPDTSGVELLIESLLGPLHEYDLRTGSELHRTLEVFLKENRSWKVAAELLYVHRQTLIHRIKRIEQLTGRRLDSTDDVSDLWLALKAERALRAAANPSS